MNLKKSFIVIFIVLLIDQWSKIYIKTNFQLHEFVNVFGLEWFKIQFIENDGMAWGMEIPGNYGKLILTTFRILIVAVIFYWLNKSIKEKAHFALPLALSFIIAGAVGNILDSIFYGVIFDHSYGQVATMFAENPYGTWFYGKVVDMLYFPIWHGDLPNWLPFWGGKPFTFFNAIFNVADVAINIGVILMILFNGKIFKK